MTGAARLSGRFSMDNGDKARLSYRLNTFGVRPPPPPVPPPGPVTTPPPAPSGPGAGPGPAPDLVVTAVGPSSVTVKNQGTAIAGPFTVTVTGRGTPRFESGLAPGASMTRGYADPVCGGDYQGIADSGSEVPESNEANNTLDVFGVVC